MSSLTDCFNGAFPSENLHFNVGATWPRWSEIHMPDEIVHTLVTQEDLTELRRKCLEDIAALREQILILQARATAMEGQLARIEPMVEARASRTEKLVMELQIEMNKLTKAISGKEKTETTQYSKIETMLKTLIERSEGMT
jgi:ABC-type enterochelin transport system substrate-binding protein